MPNDDQFIAQLDRHCEVLDARFVEHRRLEPYYEGSAPLPAAVKQARMVNAYRYLMPMADGPWGSLIVDANLHRLEAVGLSDAEDAEAARRCWRVWQTNKMDAESKLAHNAAFLDGRAFALVWPEADEDEPRITLDDSTQMVVEYEEGSRHRRVAATRRWIDEGGRTHATLYRRDGTFKFRSRIPAPGTVETARWERRDDEDEEWPLPNPDGEIPVVELAVNRRLKPGSFGYARGEFAHVTGLIDRINLLTFLGLVVAIWQGFPLRGVIGEAILEDDDGNVIPPFDANADSVFQLENKDAQIVTYEAADRKNLSVFAELDQLAVLTATPRHYFPMEGGMGNLSADAIRASEGALSAKIKRSHKPSLSEGWEEVLRLAGRMLPDPVELSPVASLDWDDHESRSLAERGDVYSKLGDLPWMVKAEIALGANAETLTRWATAAASDPLAILARGALEPPAPAPSTA